ncbi:Integrase/recombinase, subgroup 2 [Roseomonas mucosa]|uniref:Phage integrase family n=2 Tax=Roseomonadaceae TaxID=3385906 RepID=A0A379N507_9PROT|nr:Integrase/recombinase, subgroup 2 [Roseomonas mucosa]SUE41470.1 Phage integrase family [Roseomonas mucosa]
MAPMAINLQLRGAVYRFRRRVPDSLVERIGRKEIIRSLETSSRAEAGLRARVAWLATERVFGMVRANKSLERAQIDELLRRLTDEAVQNSPTRAELSRDFERLEPRYVDLLFGDEGRRAILSHPGKEQDLILEHLERLLDGAEIAVLKEATETAQTEARVHEIRRTMAERERRDMHWMALAAMLMLKEERSAKVPTSAALPASEATAEPKDAGRKESAPAALMTTGASSLAFLAHRDAYLASRVLATDDFPALKPNSIKQATKTLELWAELMGDRPIAVITKVEARRFRILLRTLPAAYGKAVRAGPVSLEAEIQRARARQAEVDGRNASLAPDMEREADIALVGLRTVKRHFSALSAYWQWLANHSYAPEDANPFIGFSWPGVRKGRKGRDMWSEQDLRTLLTSPRFASGSERGSFWWITIIGMYSGMRVEEIARLRIRQDIRDLHGRLAFVVQEQLGVWSPKTEAGARIVPVHPLLLKLGFHDFVERRAAQGHQRLFYDLPPRGKEQSYGADFSREFSKYKAALGIGPGTVFHSFRHSVRTILTNAPADQFRDAWIDAFMGHSADEDADEGRPKRQSVGVTVYLKAVDMENLCKVVEAIRYPVEPTP